MPLLWMRMLASFASSFLEGVRLDLLSLFLLYCPLNQLGASFGICYAFHMLDSSRTGTTVGLGFAKS